MSHARYTLYGRKGSGSQIPEMLLHEVEAEYDLVWVPEDAATLEGYRDKNPLLKVPALGLPDGSSIFESAAISLYLCSAHPGANLEPTVATAEHGRFLQWMIYLSTNVYETALRIYYPQRYSADIQGGADGIKTRAVHDYVRLLGLIGDRLDPFVLGSELSAADFYLYVVSAWHPEGREIIPGLFPNIAQHRNLLSRRESVKQVEQQHASS